MDWFKIGKGVREGCALSPGLFNLHAVYIIRNVGLDDSQAGIKISGRNTNSLRYAGNITLMVDPWGHKESDTTERLNWTELNWMAESKEELKGLLDEGEREEWQSWIKTQH